MRRSHSSLRLGKSVLLLALITLAAAPFAFGSGKPPGRPPGPGGEPPRPRIGPGANTAVSSSGCFANELQPNDDESSALVRIGFSIQFGPRYYSSLYVNNNGNVTFAGPSSTWTPYDLASSAQPVIAAFLADVDTRGDGSGATHWGNTTYAGHPAFCVTWGDANGTGVGYYDGHADALNYFQLLLVQRSDQGNGSFDIVFNYDQIEWEAGDLNGGYGGLCSDGCNPPVVGYSNAAGDSYEVDGSSAPGAFLDGSGTALASSSNVGVAGRFVFAQRSTHPDSTQSMLWSGFVAPSPSLSHPVYGQVTLPAVTCNVAGVAAFWVGYDGETTSPVEQDGASATCSQPGAAPRYSLWWELFPDLQQPVRLPANVTIGAGDTVAMSVSARKGWTTYGYSTQPERIAFRLQVKSPGGSTIFNWSTTKTPKSALPFASSECIVETPELAEPRAHATVFVRLPYFDTVTFSSCSALSDAAPSSLTHLDIFRSSQWLTTSTLNGSQFSVDWLASG